MVGAVRPPVPAGASPLARAALAAFAVGIPLDVMLATQLGSSSLVLGVPLALAAGWQIISARCVRTVPASLLLASAFTAWAATSAFWTIDWEGFTRSMTVLFQLLAFMLLSWQILRARTDVRAMLAGFVVGCTITAVDVWRSFFSGEGFRDMSRYAAEAYDPNDMAVTLAIGIPPAAYLALAGARRRYTVLAYLPLAGSAIALSGSRAGGITAAAALACVGAWGSRRSKRALVVALALGLGGTVFAWKTIPDTVWARMFTLRTELAEGDLNGRVAIWRAGFDVFAAHPIAGVGQGSFGMAVSKTLQAKVSGHSTLLPVAAELGGIGLSLFVASFAATLWLRRGTARDDRLFVWVLLLTWGVGSASLTWELRKTTWFVLLVAAAVRALRPTVHPAPSGEAVEPAPLPGER